MGWLFGRLGDGSKCAKGEKQGKCENGILKIDNGRFYGYNKSILVAAYMKKIRWDFFVVKYMKKGFSRPFLSCRAQKKRSDGFFE